MNKERIHTLSVLTANKPGVLVRIAQVFARRGFNIDSLVVSPAVDGRFARMTITGQGDPERFEQIVKQVDKLVDVLQASEHNERNTVTKEMAFFKVQTSDQNRTSVLQLVEHFKGKTVDYTAESLIIEVTGLTSKIDAFEKMLQEFGILEMVRSGKMVMSRGASST